ncbi:odorant receptor 103-1 [Sinocyclocheilus grahami]|uniref:Olfactory receptor n=1 Tax=Sinocyclocheilus grahami TaxID=75366 RepID=A0A672M9B2_SINGR|nr:PREDICTED: olfactory receptor 2AT4-like [Sinocyclocheilus grahami]
MSSGNISFVKDFFIVGFPGLQPEYYGVVAALLLFAYVCILVGNGTFIALFTLEKCLHKPMYYIILNLVVSDLLFSTTTLPKIIARYWFQAGSISFTGCFIQMYFVHYFGSVSSVILAIMAYDRYVAICNPLRYPNIVTKLDIFCLCLAAWVLTHACPLMMAIRAYPLPYCAGNTIIHCYCDHISITSLACTNRALYGVPAFAFAMVVLLSPLAFIVFSYCAIIVAVLRISTTQGRLKSFSTCSPQLIIIALYFLPRCFIYLSSNIGINFSTDLRLVIIMLYSLFPPMINPLIYCLRTKDVKETLLKRIKVSMNPLFIPTKVNVSTVCV